MKASPFDNVNYFFDGIMFSLPANGYIFSATGSIFCFSQLLNNKKKNPGSRTCAILSGFTAGSRDRTDTPYWGTGF